MPTPELSPHYQSTPRQPPGNNVSIPTRGSGQGARSSSLDPDLSQFFPLSPRTVSIPHSPRSPWRLQPQISHCQLSFHCPQVTHIPASYTVRGGTATWDLWTAMLQRTGGRKTTLTKDAQGAHPSLCSRYRSSPGPSPMPSASIYTPHSNQPTNPALGPRTYHIQAVPIRNTHTPCSSSP